MERAMERHETALGVEGQGMMDDPFEAILKEVQYRSAIYELDRYAAKIDNAQYDELINKLVQWARECIDKEKQVHGVNEESIRKSYRDLLADTITL